MELVIVVLFAVLAGHLGKRAYQRRLLSIQAGPRSPQRMLASPASDIAEQLEEVGFIPWAGRVGKIFQGRLGDLLFRNRKKDCAACHGTVYELLRVLGEHPGYVTEVFAEACAHCHHLHAIESVPARIRHAWESAEDLADFLTRMRLDPEPPKETLAQKKRRLERELVNTEARRDQLRLELRSVENRINAPSDDEPYR